jgi:hypothetical protein
MFWNPEIWKMVYSLGRVAAGCTLHSCEID